MSGSHLGYVLWYTVKPAGESTTLDVTAGQLRTWLKELKLDESYVPKPNKTVDAFRSATSVTSQPYLSEDELRYELTVVETKREPNLVLRQVMRRALDPGGKTIRVAELKYFRPRRTATGRIQGSEDVKSTVHRGLQGIDLKMVHQFVDECIEGYEQRQRRQLTLHSMRALLRLYLANLGGIPLPDATGTYFAPAEALEDVRGLQTLVSWCSDKSRLRVMPLVDDNEQRAMLREAIDAEVDERATRALADISQWQDEHPGEAPGPRTTRAWYQGCRHLMDLLATYGHRYGMTFPEAADSLENLRQAVHRLTARGIDPDRRRGS